MTTVAPLNSNQHLDLCIKQSNDFSRFAENSLIPVVLQEFVILATEFPIVFVKNSENGQFTPIAMMGIKNNLNLYCQTDSWSASVKPLGFSNAPLSLKQTSENSDEAMIFIDEDSELVSNDTGNKLFDAEGEQSEYLKKRANALVDLASFTLQTSAVVKRFAELNLLTPKQLTVKLSSDSPVVNIDGVYIIDEKALDELKDEDFLTLKNQGLLPLIYAHLTSIHQIGRLIAKQNEHDKAKS